MDITNLKARQCILTEFLKANSFSKDVRGNITSCIGIAIDTGSDPEIRNYEDLFMRVTLERGIERNSPRYRRLRHGIGTVWAFDLHGKLPDGKPTGFLRAETTVDRLNPYFRTLADTHLTNGAVNGKKAKTVRTEHNAAVNLYAHFQKEGASTLEDVTPDMVFSFFHKGERQLRGADYRSLVRSALKAVDGDNRVAAKTIISWLPGIKRSRKLFDFLSAEEGDSIRRCLEDGCNSLSTFERTVGWILYFYGLRGTDIADLQLSSIDWVNDRICLVQSKTGYPITLPMNAAVGNSLFDYITTRLPKVCGPGHVFMPSRKDGILSHRIKYAVQKIFKA